MRPMASEAPPDWLLALIPLGFLIGFPLFWCAIVLLLSRLSGWHRLSERFRARAPFAGATRSGCYGRLGHVSYRGTLTLGANDTGLYLAVMKIFAMGHPPLFIPWTEIRARRGRMLFIPVVTLAIGSPPTELRIHQKFSEPLERAANGRLAIEG
jgi:hypothetical protein